MYEPPRAVQIAIDELVEAASTYELRRAADRLSERYRDAYPPTGRFVDDDAAALAYLAYRMPATYAAARAVFAEVARRKPDLHPKTLIDVGAGPGTAAWAAADCWHTIREVHHVERDRRFAELADHLGRATPLPRVDDVRWHVDDVRTGSLPDGDIVVACYLLSELSGGDLAAFVKAMWEATSDSIVIVEPGTPRGYKRILVARDTLIELGGQIVAPCPSMDACPLARAESWCHFAERLPRSEAHRQVKNVRLPYEDEKYSYVAASRRPGTPIIARVIGMPKRPGGVVLIPTCEGATVDERVVSRRHGDAYRRAKRLTWSSAIEEDLDLA